MFTPLTLPNGSRLSNRLAKAAMEEIWPPRANCPARRCGAYTATGPKAAPA
ncbi:hypothetical protein M8494_10935 [Serratia ureilytica]